MTSIANRNIASAFHSCGKLDQVIPFLIRLGCGAVQALQPNRNDIYAVRQLNSIPPENFIAMITTVQEWR